MGPWWYHRHNVCLWKHRSSHAHSVPLLTPSRQIKCQDVSVLLVWPTSQSLFAPRHATGQGQRQGQQTAGAEPLASRCCAMLHHAASGSQWGLPHHPVPLCFLNQPVEERIPCLGSRIFRNSGSGADCGRKQIGNFSVEQICSKSHKLSVNSTTRWPADSNCIVAKMHLKRWCASSIPIGVSKEASSTFLCELCSTYAKPHAGSRTV